MTHGIVVGYDGSQDAGLALDWAAQEAEHRQVPLTVLRVLDLTTLTPGLVMPQVRLEPRDEVAAEGVVRARKSVVTTDVTPETKIGKVASSLIESSRDADLLVVGTRGHGEALGSLIGSVAFAVSGHAFCPVVVVRGDTSQAIGPDRPVVVGADGSAGSDVAVRFAADAAAGASAPLIIVTVYSMTASAIWSEASVYTAANEGGPTFGSDVEQAAIKVAAAAAGLAREAQPGLSIKEVTREGRVDETLSAEALGCGLLVVGSRGRGGFTGLILGSVGHGAIHFSPCPVAVIRAGRPA